MYTYRQLLKHNPDFARLWLAQVISLLGDWFNTIVLSALVSKYADGSGVAVSAFLLARMLPPLIVSPWAGVLVDRFDRKRLLILSDVLRALVVMLLLFASTPDRLWLIYVLTVIQFALSAIFDPGRSAIMPSLLRSEDLVTANTLSSVTWSFMLAIGAIIGGVIAAAFGTAVALIIDALTFIISALLIAGIKAVRSEIPIESTHKAVVNRGFVEGLRYAVKHPATSITLLVKLGQSLGNVDALMIVYATKLFVIGEGGTTSLSLMWAAFGAGAVLGPMILNRFNDGSVRTMRKLIIVGYGLATLGWLTFGGASSLAIVGLAMVIRAMGGSVNWTYSSVIIQKSTPDAYLGRMFSLDMAGFQFASIISIVLTGFLIETLGTDNVRQVVAIMGGISLIPLVGWTLAVQWLNRRPVVAVAAGD